jgi:hypothetical protein
LQEVLAQRALFEQRMIQFPDRFDSLFIWQVCFCISPGSDVVDFSSVFPSVSELLVHMATDICTVSTVQLALDSTTAISVLRFLPGPENLHYP